MEVVQCAELRRWRIDEADRFSAKAETLVTEARNQKTAAVARLRRRRAARFHEHAAAFYALAGLGLSAAHRWHDAAECWTALGRDAERIRCEGELAAIERELNEANDQRAKHLVTHPPRRPGEPPSPDGRS